MYVIANANVRDGGKSGTSGKSETSEQSGRRRRKYGWLWYKLDLHWSLPNLTITCRVVRGRLTPPPKLRKQVMLLTVVVSK